MSPGSGQGVHDQAPLVSLKEILQMRLVSPVFRLTAHRHVLRPRPSLTPHLVSGQCSQACAAEKGFGTRLPPDVVSPWFRGMSRAGIPPPGRSRPRPPRPRGTRAKARPGGRARASASRSSRHEAGPSPPPAGWPLFPFPPLRVFQNCLHTPPSLELSPPPSAPPPHPPL